MGAAYFYHLTDSTLEQTLMTLIGRAQQQGWSVEVRGVDPERMDRLDQALWLGPDDSFLAHGLAGGPDDAAQPVLLTTGPALRDCLLAVDGAEVTLPEVTASQRVCILFDGHDTDALARARIQWKALTKAGCAAQYWAQDAGRWVMKAEATTA